MEKILAACPDNEWRLIVTLARYGGLRVPSELATLTWDRVDWERGRLTVRVAKKEHLVGHEERQIPIFPEIRPWLDAAFEAAPPGSVYVVPRARLGNVNLRTGLERILKRAAVAQWPKLFVNLRASRETELMLEHPEHVVVAWLGHTKAVAAEHYLMVTDGDFERAAAASIHPAQNPAQSAAFSGLHGPSAETKPAVSPAFASDTAVSIPPRGVEPRFSD